MSLSRYEKFPEDAGVLHPDHAQVGREVELDAVNLSVADIARLEHEGARAFRTLDAGIGQLDQVGDLAIEEVDADHAGVADAVLVPASPPQGELGAQVVRIALEIIVAELGEQGRRREIIEPRAAIGARAAESVMRSDGVTSNLSDAEGSRKP